MPDTNPYAVPRAGLSARPPAALAPVGIAAWAVLCLLLLFCAAMTGPVGFDQDPFIAAGVMVRPMLPYRDFVYLQPPLYPLVLSLAFEFAQGWFTLAARLFGFGLAATSGAMLWHVLRRLGAGPVLSVVLLTACLASPYVTATLADAPDTGLALTLLLAGLAAQLWIDRTRHELTARLLAALLFGLAAATKLPFLFGPAILLLHALARPLRRLGPVLLGLSLAALPVAYCWSEAPEGFWFGVIEYHLIAPSAWSASAGLDGWFAVWARLQAVADDAVVGGNLTLLVLSIALSLLAIARRRRWQHPGRLLLALAAGAFALALVPAPGRAANFAPVAVLLACCIAHLDRITTEVAGVARKRILVAVTTLASLSAILPQLAELPRLLDPERWAGVAVHRNAEAIRDAVADPIGDVATLFPMLVIDANPVRPEFSTGPFVFRSGAGAEPARLSRLHAISPATLAAAFDADPPRAIYAGRYAGAWRTPMDAPLAAYATSHAWRLAREDAAGGRLWVRP